MPKFRIAVKIKAEVEYTVEVEAATEFEAEDKATGLWAEKTPSDFDVNKGYITDWEVENTEQLTHVCERCDMEYPADVNTIINGEGPLPLRPWKEDQDYCEMCGPIIEVEEKAEDDARTARLLALRARRVAS